MRFVITGATGHIGNNLVRLLNEKDPEAEIITLLRRKNPKELEGTEVTQVIGDFSDKFLEENIKEGDIVVHLAGLIDLSNKKKEETYKINYLLTKSITDIALKNNAKRFIYVGSVDGIYREGDGKIAEPEEYYPDKIEDNYGKTKAMASGYVLQKMRDNPQFNVAIVLPTAVIGINDYKPSAVGKIIASVLGGGAEFGMKGGYNFVDVEDVASAIYTLCQNDLKGQYIISGTSVSVEKLYKAINEYKNFSKKPIIFPTWLVRLACPFVKVLNKITVKALLEPHDYTSKRAEDDFGYKATEFSITLAKTIDWFENNGVKEAEKKEK